MANKKFEFDTDGFKYYHNIYVESPISNEKLRAQSAENTLNGKVSALETAVGSGGSVDSRISAAVATETTRAQAAELNIRSEKADKATTLVGYGITDAYTKSETYTKTEVNGLVDTPNQEYVTVSATSQTTAATAVLPNSGQSADTIYRVANWDGSANSGAGGYDVTKYSEYAWDDVSNPNKYVFLCVKPQIDEVFDISVYNNNAKYADLAAALGNDGANVPQYLRRGGMSVKFVSSVDNMYIQARCMAQNFTTDVTQWQGVDDEPTAGSENLVKSAGIWQIPKFLFAENCPWIKEMYINQEGIDVGINTVNNIYSDYILFAKDSSTFSGCTISSENNGINKIYYFDGSLYDTTRVLGFIIVDWAAVPPNQTDGNRINDIAKNVQYSPAIEADLIHKNLQVLQDNTLGSDTATKDYSILENQGRDLNSAIFFQYPKNYKVEKVNQIRYKVLSGTVNFHKVTINGGIGTFQLIATDTNDSGDGTIKVLPISEQTLAENEYIGISGNFYFEVDANAQGFTGGRVDISTGSVTTGGVIALGFDAEYSDSLSTKVKNLQDEMKSINISSYGATEGDVISNYDNIVVLASDGIGDFTTFTDAHAFCSNATNKYKTTLVIMPGIYDIPVNTDVGNVICYNIKGVGNPILKSYNETGNVDIKTTFSPFMMDTNTPSSHQSVSIEGVTVIGKNVRYCVHDELGGLQNISYTHVFKNCKFVHLTAPDSEWAEPRCIGGGLGNNGLVIIDNCEFQSEIATSVDYHTGFDGGAESSKVIVKDCILANNTVSCTSTTYPSDLSVMVVQDCIIHSEPIYTDEHNNQDFKLISKNNIIV